MWERRGDSHRGAEGLAAGCRSVEDGLLTVVLRGKDTMPSDSSLTVEDLVTLHVTGDALYGQVAAAMGADGSAGGLQASRKPPERRSYIVALWQAA